MFFYSCHYSYRRKLYLHENIPREKKTDFTKLIYSKYIHLFSSILVVVDVSSYLGGYFEFRICPHNNPTVAVTQDCLDQYQLKVWDVIDNQAGYRYGVRRQSAISVLSVNGRGVPIGSQALIIIQCSRVSVNPILHIHVYIYFIILV